MPDKLHDLIKATVQNARYNLVGVVEDSAVKFGNQPYPRSGWAVFTCGGPGSGKSYTIRNQLLIDAKVLDSDNIKMLYVKLLEKLVNSPETSPRVKEQILEPYGGRLPDPKNPRDMEELHKYTSWKRHLFSKALDSFLRSSGKRLQNFVIDTTGNNVEELVLNTRLFKDLGYRVALVWVVTSIDLAKIRNKTRDRVVPEDYLEHVHRKILNTIPRAVRQGLLNTLDELWVVFSKNTDEGMFRSRFRDTAFKLEKVNGRFELSDEMLQRITQHVNPGEASHD